MQSHLFVVIRLQHERRWQGAADGGTQAVASATMPPANASRAPAAHIFMPHIFTADAVGDKIGSGHRPG